MDIMLERVLDCIGPRHGATKELAEYLGISPNVITSWKNGRNKSYRKYLKQIAAFYGVSVEFLQGVTDQPTEETKKSPAEAEEEEINEYLEVLKNNPGMRILFSKTKNATKEDLEKVVKMIEIMKGDSY